MITKFFQQFEAPSGEGASAMESDGSGDGEGGGAGSGGIGSGDRVPGDGGGRDGDEGGRCGELARGLVVIVLDALGPGDTVEADSQIRQDRVKGIGDDGVVCGYQGFGAEVLDQEGVGHLAVAQDLGGGDGFGDGQLGSGGAGDRLAGGGGSAEGIAGFYCLLFLKDDAGRAQAQYGTGLLILFAAVFFFGFLLIQFIFGLLNLRASAATTEAYQQATASEKTLEKKVWLVLGLPVVFAILPAIMFLRVEHIPADGTVYQFVKGKQISYEGGGKIRRGDNGCLLAQDKETIVLDPSVIYFDGEEKLVFSSVCSVVQPTVQLSNRIQPMSILEKSGDSYSVIYDKKTIGLEDFFFFDGKDTYYFPAGTLLEWEDESYLTQSICMVTAKYGQSIVLYDLAERNYREIPAESGYCTALLADRTSVNLSTDIIYRENGQEQMLFMQPSLLTDLE